MLVHAVGRDDQTQTSARTKGDFGACSKLEGEAARACYRAEVGRELASVGAVGTPKILFSAPANGNEVTFADASSEAQPLLCALHTRVGVTDASIPSWVSWSEPIAQAAPVS
jgi:hypothetical protein